MSVIPHVHRKSHSPRYGRCIQAPVHRPIHWIIRIGWAKGMRWWSRHHWTFRSFSHVRISFVVHHGNLIGVGCVGHCKNWVLINSRQVEVERCLSVKVILRRMAIEISDRRRYIGGRWRHDLRFFRRSRTACSCFQHT